MRPTSALYKRLLAAPEHRKETMVEIAGVEYSEDRLFSCAIDNGVLPDSIIGGCISHDLSLTIDPIGEIPRMAQIKVFSRLILGDETSEWVSSGVFYIDTRRTDKVSGLMALHGFDAMLKAEAVWWDPSVDAGVWPMSQEAAVVDIARQMGVSIDPRTQIDASLMVEYPNDLTMREVLAEIAVAHGGNWVMTGDGELLLAPFGGVPPETNFLVDGEDGGAILFGGVRIIV